MFTFCLTSPARQKTEKAAKKGLLLALLVAVVSLPLYAVADQTHRYADLHAVRAGTSANS